MKERWTICDGARSSLKMFELATSHHKFEVWKQVSVGSCSIHAPQPRVPEQIWRQAGVVSNKLPLSSFKSFHFNQKAFAAPSTQFLVEHVTAYQDCSQSLFPSQQFCVSQMLPQLDPGAQFCRLQFIMSGRFANFLLISPNRPLARSLGKFAGEKICKLGKVSIRTRHTQLNLVCILANPEISHKSLQFISNGWRRRHMLAF